MSDTENPQENTDNPAVTTETTTVTETPVPTPDPQEGNTENNPAVDGAPEQG